MFNRAKGFITSKVAAALTRLAIGINDKASFDVMRDTVRPWQVFDLNFHAADYILPRLERMIKNINESKSNGVPMTYRNEDEWLHDLETVARFLKYILMKDNVIMLSDSEYEYAKRIFGKVFVTLWD